jgi:hypothetical protein
MILYGSCSVNCIAFIEHEKFTIIDKILPTSLTLNPLPEGEGKKLPSPSGRRVGMRVQLITNSVTVA